MSLVAGEQLEEGLCQIGRMALGKAISILWIIVIQPLHHWLGRSLHCWSSLGWSRLEDGSQHTAFPVGPVSSGKSWYDLHSGANVELLGLVLS